MAGSSFLPPAVFEIKAIADQAIAQFGEVNKELDKMSKEADTAGGKISGLDKASKVATAGLLAMGAAFVGFAAFGIKEANEAEQALSKLGVTLANFGVNTPKVRKEVEDLTGSYVNLGFGGEEAAAGFDTLFRSTGDLDTAQKLLATSADLARVKNISLADASSIVAKANQGSAKAFKEMGIELDTSLPRAQMLEKAMGELSAKIGGQATAYTKTFAGQLAVTKEKFADVAETLGTTLLPYIQKFMDLLSDTVEFVKKNSSWLTILAGVIITVTVALAAYNATIKVIAATTKVWTAITTVQKTVMAMMTGQQLALNAAMTVNPIGLIVAASVLLIGALVLLWNKSESFRKMVIEVGKAGIKAFAFILGVVGDLATGFIKIATGPLKLLLKGLALLGVGPAKTALKGLETATEGVGKFFDSAAKKVEGMSKNLDKLNKPIKLTFATPKIPDMPNVAGGGVTGGGGGGGGDAKTKKANEGYMKIVKDLNEKVASARTKFNEKMAELEKDYNETTTNLRADAAKKIESVTKDHNERVDKLNIDAKRKMKEAQVRFNDTMADLNEKKGQDLAKAESDNAKKVSDIYKAHSDKLKSLVEESANRLRDAFKKGTEFNPADIFKGLVEAGTANAEKLLEAMKNKIASSKELAKNAALLQAKGFSQTFIEQVVSAGPEIGNQLSKSILDASPETVKELQEAYKDMEATSDHGVDALAKSMSTFGNLATEELNQAYTQAQSDLKSALADQANEYLTAQAEINTAFNKAMTDAEATRDTAIASAQADLAEALAEENKNFAESVAEINADLAESLAEAQKDFVEASEQARKDLADSLTAIEKEFKDKLGKITDATKATNKEIAALLANFNNTKKLLETPIVIPAPVYAAGSGGGAGGSSSSSSSSSKTATTNITTNVTANTNASPASIASAVTSVIKFGNTIVPSAPSKLASGESGAIGAASIKARTTTISGGGGGGGGNMVML
jgi:hypothetical protein